MSYFDHVQCHSCGARMDPEQLVSGPGEMPACPHCKASLNLTDLFGVKDAFVGMHDDQGNDHTLDDLVGGDLYDGRYVDGRAPDRQPAPPPPRAPQAPRQSAGTSRPTGGGWSRREAQSPPRGLPGPTAASRGNALIRTPQRDEEPASGGAPSAADLLREMRKKR